MSITLSYPAYAATQVSTISIKEPEMLDGQSSTYRLTTLLTRGGTFKTNVTHDKDQTVYSTSLEFTNLCEADKALLETFVLAAQGEYVLYTDYNAGEWYCVIVDEELDFTTTGKGPLFSTSLTLNRWEKT